ncbi:MMPL family transporter [Lysinibacter sp. HNR]|uniref:MMPL family transporter n=1 Tax=Lysinibacter sp. HNR TaxID=3031408 RepID=UPI0024354267|nr:MMPL family transporter [Lysinibacter sp. HNR]WGD37470.1 MMPL family transporter [Lysinibacter sp. HNR]
MSSLLYSLGRWSFRSRRLVVALWIAVLAAVGGGAFFFNQGTDNTFSIPGTESQEALTSLRNTFPEVSGTSAQIVIVAPEGSTVDNGAVEGSVKDAIERIDNITQVSAAVSPFNENISGTISDDQRAAVITVQLDGSLPDITQDTKDALNQAGDDLRADLPSSFEVSVGGEIFSQSFPSLSIVELLGVLIALVVLLLTLGAFVAAGMPLLNALLGVAVSVALIFLATVFGPVSSTTPMLALMLGLAVGIDYALFVLSRHQEQLIDGLTPEESAAKAVATAGSAVIFAGLTVIISLLGLAVANIPFLTVMGVAAAGAVAIAVLISITLTPALLGFAGLKILPRRKRKALAARAAAAAGSIEDEAAALSSEVSPDIATASAGTDTGGTRNRIQTDTVTTASATASARTEAFGATSAATARTASEHTTASSSIEDAAVTHTNPTQSPTPTTPSHEQPAKRGFFSGWVRAVTRFPLVTILAVVAALGVATIPALDLRLALPDAGTLPEDNQARVTYDLLSENFGPGFNGPLIVTGSIVSSTDPVGLMQDIGNELRELDGVAAVPLATPNQTADTGIVQVVPEGSPESEETKALVQEIRSLHDHFLDEYGVDLSVTGFTAVGIDISDRLGGALLPFGILVVGLSLVLLTMVFRSIWVPIKATLGYLLSVGASFGVVSAVFGWGWFAEPLHLTSTGPVISFMPIILMGVLFGLAMDYEVFLVSRIREEYVHGGDAQKAIHKGFLGSARVVTAAAVIMFAIFAAFVPEGDSSLKPIALGLAVGVFVDAFIVRMTLVPAVLALLGDRAWWIPRWLDRLLPSFDIEGEGVQHELALAAWPSANSTAAITASHLSLNAQGDTGTTSIGAPVLFNNLDLSVAENGSLVVTGGTPEARRALLLTLSGRLPHFMGQLKVAGSVLPQRGVRVRSRTSLVLAADSSNPLLDLRAALSDSPSIVFVDAADSLIDAAGIDAVHSALEHARDHARSRGTSLAYVFACADSSALLKTLDALATEETQRPTVLNLDTHTAAPTLEKVL